MSMEGIKRSFENAWEKVEQFPARIQSKWKAIPENGKTRIALIAGAVAIVASLVFALALSPVGLAPLGALLGLGVGLGVGLYMIDHFKGDGIREKVEYGAANALRQSGNFFQNAWKTLKGE